MNYLQSFLLKLYCLFYMCFIEICVFSFTCRFFLYYILINKQTTRLLIYNSFIIFVILYLTNSKATKQTKEATRFKSKIDCLSVCLSVCLSPFLYLSFSFMINLLENPILVYKLDSFVCLFAVIEAIS